MRKVLMTTIASVALVALSAPVLAGIDYCSDNSCWFWTLTKKPSKKLYFHCKVADNVSHVEFENHNILISGFTTGSGPRAGTLSLDGRAEVSKLYTYYFQVMDDPTRGRFDPKTVVFKADGRISCDIGKGGRALMFGSTE